MEKEFIPYKESLSLKELGFDEQCLALYDLDGKITIEFVNWKNAVNRKNNYLISAPLYQQAFRWFREKYSYNGSVYPLTGKFSSQVYDIFNGCYITKIDLYKTHEEAELKCLKKLIEICSKLK